MENDMKIYLEGIKNCEVDPVMVYLNDKPTAAFYINLKEVGEDEDIQEFCNLIELEYSKENIYYMVFDIFEQPYLCMFSMKDMNITEITDNEIVHEMANSIYEAYGSVIQEKLAEVAFAFEANMEQIKKGFPSLTSLVQLNTCVTFDRFKDVYGKRVTKAEDKKNFINGLKKNMEHYVDRSYYNDKIGEITSAKDLYKVHFDFGNNDDKSFHEFEGAIKNISRDEITKDYINKTFENNCLEEILKNCEGLDLINDKDINIFIERTIKTLDNKINNSSDTEIIKQCILNAKSLIKYIHNVIGDKRTKKKYIDAIKKISNKLNDKINDFKNIIEEYSEEDFQKCKDEIKEEKDIQPILIEPEWKDLDEKTLKKLCRAGKMQYKPTDKYELKKEKMFYRFVRIDKISNRVIDEHVFDYKDIVENLM